MRVLITGASGSGTTTLGKTLAQICHAQFFDSDDYFWVPSDPPYQEQVSREERLTQILKELGACQKAVVSGSVMGWGEPLESSFSLVVFLQVPTHIRLERIKIRELARFGKINPAFLEWAAQYDEGPPEGRSLVKHNAWLNKLHCPVVRLVGKLSQSEQLELIAKAVPNTKVERDSQQAALVGALATLGCPSLSR